MYEVNLVISNNCRSISKYLSFHTLKRTGNTNYYQSYFIHCLLFKHLETNARKTQCLLLKKFLQSQQLWLPTQESHKIGSISIQLWGKAHGPHPSLRIYMRLMMVGGGRDIFYGGVATGKVPRLLQATLMKLTGTQRHDTGKKWGNKRAGDEWQGRGMTREGNGGEHAYI